MSMLAFTIAAMIGGAAPAPTECVYDYSMITPQECRAYRTRVLRAASDDERLALLGNIREVMDARARDRGISPDDWRGLSVAPLAALGGALSASEITMLLALLAAIVAIPYLAFRTTLPDNTRLMRCPETGAIALVNAGAAHGKSAERGITVKSCNLWPERKDCAQGCLVRYPQTRPGYRVNVEALRPFHRP